MTRSTAPVGTLHDPLLRHRIQIAGCLLGSSNSGILIWQLWGPGDSYTSIRVHPTRIHAHMFSDTRSTPAYKGKPGKPGNCIPQDHELEKRNICQTMLIAICLVLMIMHVQHAMTCRILTRAWDLHINVTASALSWPLAKRSLLIHNDTKHEIITIDDK